MISLHTYIFTFQYIYKLRVIISPPPIHFLIIPIRVCNKAIIRPADRYCRYIHVVYMSYKHIFELC